MQLVINSKFRPFSYDELVKPLMQYKEAYDKVEADYSNLAAQTEVWKNVVNQTQSPEAYAMYNKYATALNEITEDFSKGMTLQNRSQLLNMKRRYASDIVPIATAATRRKELADEQRKLSAQDPTRIWQHNANEMGLDELIKNPSADYGQSVSGATLTTQVANAASALAKEFRNNPEELKKIAGGQYYEYVKQRGFSSKAVLDAILNDPNASPVLTNLVESAIDSTGIKNWGDREALNRARQYANQGLWKAVGEAQVQNLDNKDYMNPVQKLQYAKLLQEAQQTTNGVAANPLPLYSSREQEAEERAYKDNIKLYSKFFYRDKKTNSMKMTYAGWQEYNRKVSRVKGDIMVTPEGTTILTNAKKSFDDSPFKTFIDSLGGKNVKGYQPGNFGNLWSAYINGKSKETSKLDAVRNTEYDYKISKEGQDEAKQMVLGAFSNGIDIPIVDYDNKTHSFKGTNNYVTKEQLNDKDVKLVSTRYSPYGNTAIFLDKKGNTIRVNLPKGINSSAEDSRDAMTSWLRVLQENRRGGTFTIPDDYARANNIPIGTTIKVTAEQVQDEYKKALQQAQLYHSQLFTTNKTKAQEFNTFSY